MLPQSRALPHLVFPKVVFINKVVLGGRKKGDKNEPYFWGQNVWVHRLARPFWENLKGLASLCPHKCFPKKFGSFLSPFFGLIGRSCIQILQSILLFTESTLYKLYPGMKCACRTLLWLQPNRHSPDHLDHPSQHCDVWTPQQWTQWFRYCSWAGIPEISGWIKNIFILPSGMF